MDNMKEGSCKCYSILLIGSIAVNTSTLQPTIANIVRSNTKCKLKKLLETDYILAVNTSTLQQTIANIARSNIKCKRLKA